MAKEKKPFAPLKDAGPPPTHEGGDRKVLSPDEIREAERKAAESA